MPNNTRDIGLRSALAVMDRIKGWNDAGKLEEDKPDTLDVQVRSDWKSLQHSSQSKWYIAEYQLLMSTGGPAVRIIGNVDDMGQASSAKLQWQHWFTPWTDINLGEDCHDALIAYVSTFYFE